MIQPCPCKSGKNYFDCCETYHNGTAARSPEALMRSRYSAFVAGIGDYLKSTWHNSNRPACMNLDKRIQWKHLDIRSAGEEGNAGQVHFVATFVENGAWMQLEEHSRFVLENERWYYLDGDAEWKNISPSRNDLCPCGSGKKFKKC